MSAESKLTKIRVKQHVPIPHRVIVPGIGEVSFAPRPQNITEEQTSTFNKWAERELELSTHMYEADKGQVNEADYIQRSSSQVETLHELFDSLNADQKGKALSFMQKLKADSQEADFKARQKEEEAAKKKLREEQDAAIRAQKEGKA